MSIQHGGIDVTATWNCRNVPTTIGQGLNLWLCPLPAPADEAWIVGNCTPKGFNGDSVHATVTKKKYSKTAPPVAQPAAHGNGWWIACTLWSSNGPGGQTTSRYAFSRSMELNG